jgi:hypothetical protein
MIHKNHINGLFMDFLHKKRVVYWFPEKVTKSIMVVRLKFVKKRYTPLLRQALRLR